ncbi:hypothetical protein VTN77DRAFT_9676 [Rasamsonia byssochlamydoides]|uniref:uncharacterized protein n=1 Tax=Rasamsonia byssochlamydoides TaxID=89139 RepID=UPI0037430FBC
MTSSSSVLRSTRAGRPIPVEELFLFVLKHLSISFVDVPSSKQGMKKAMFLSNTWLTIQRSHSRLPPLSPSSDQVVSRTGRESQVPHGVTSTMTVDIIGDDRGSSRTRDASGHFVHACSFLPIPSSFPDSRCPWFESWIWSRSLSLRKLFRLLWTRSLLGIHVYL